ncbi:MAG: hypothetical protein IJP30_05815 [Clostridia bacterium]|nr:hypothetical protein [Clostridia bacterium]
MKRRYKRAAYPRSSRRRGLMGSRYWPLLLIGLMIIAAILLFLLTKNTLIPALRKLFIPGDIATVPIGTPETMNTLTEWEREVLLTSKFKHVSYPVILGDDIVFAAGSDNAQNPKLAEIYIANTFTSNARTPEKVEEILAERGDILHLDVSAEYIVYFDGAKTGGGAVMLYDRLDGTVRMLAEADLGWPKPYIAGEYCVWLQRTEPTQEKLLCMDIDSGEVVTLAVFNNSALGLSEPGVQGDLVVYVQEDPEHVGSQRYNRIVLLSLKTGQQTIYDPGMYAFSPVTNGRDIAFTDKMGDVNGSLYLSLDGAMHKRIADNVSAYGLGENFLAYCRYGRIYIYDWKTGQTSQLTQNREYAMLASVSEHGVAWFDITMERRERDILKFAILD